MLVALAILGFIATTLPAQGLTPSQLQEFNAVGQQASFETYRLPVITCTVGRASLIGQTGRQVTTIERTVALLAYVVLGGILFVLVASFRLLSDKVYSFFSLSIPKPTGIQGLRTDPPPDEDFGPFKFEPAPELNAKQNTSRLAPESPLEASNSPEISMPPALEIPRLGMPPRARPRRILLPLGGCPLLNGKPKRSDFPKLRNARSPNVAPPRVNTCGL